MTHSDQINEIAAALAKAQGGMKHAKKDSANPFFKSKYADMAAVSEACRTELSSNEIAVVQTPSSTEDGRVSVTTVLMHASGQWIADTVSAKPKDDGAQALGSVITYLRRYSLASFAGVAADDDDGEAAEARGTTKPKVELTKPAGFDDWLIDMESVATEGTAALQAAWKKSAAAYRNAIDPKAWEAIKAKAAKVPEAVSA